VRDTLEVDFGESDAFFLSHIQHNFAPGVDHETMAEGISAVLMMPDLGRGHDEQPGLNRPSTEQYVPVRQSRRNSECCGHGYNVRVGLGEPREQSRKA